ncbi:MAG: DUF1553 domain-containing protein [Planctomycetales bacterium]|nr:DUF1553 domain-containing protein [Planctomycetales bacterium]
MSRFLELKAAILAVWLCAACGALQADQPLHERIDAIIEAAARNDNPAPIAEDFEFVRRIYLDLAGRIPTATEARAFVADTDEDKRSRLIRTLLESDGYAPWMQVRFSSMLMERRGDDEHWRKYLTDAFAANRPWDAMVRDMLRPSWSKEAVPGAAYFVAKRLEKYGQQPTDYPGLTRDVGRLFLGVDLKCAQCHDHLVIDDYKQRDFQGLFVVFNNTYLQTGGGPPGVGEKLLTAQIEFASVFDKVALTTGPKVPGRQEIPLPEFAEGEQYLEPPDRKTRSPGVPRFSPLETLAREITTADNDAFVRNIVNRLWFVMMGHGVVEPLDQHHGDNPPSHPELLAALSEDFAASGMDIKRLLSEIAQSRAYQRTSATDSHTAAAPRSFLAAYEKPLLPEQLFASVLAATGPHAEAETAAAREKLLPEFVKAFAGPPAEPELAFAPTLKSALFLMNDPAVEKLLSVSGGNLIDRATKLRDAAAVDELYVSVLSRLPRDQERTAAEEYLQKHVSRRPQAVANLAWSLLASTEFCTNH